MIVSPSFLHPLGMAVRIFMAATDVLMAEVTKLILWTPQLEYIF